MKELAEARQMLAQTPIRAPFVSNVVPKKQTPGEALAYISQLKREPSNFTPPTQRLSQQLNSGMSYDGENSNTSNQEEDGVQDSIAKLMELLKRSETNQ